jgi:hypothetical protein
LDSKGRIPEYKVHRGTWVLTGIRETKVSKEFREIRALKESREVRGIKETKESRDTKEYLVHKARILLTLQWVTECTFCRFPAEWRRGIRLAESLEDP